MLEFLCDYPCGVNLERDYEKMQVSLRIFRNVGTDFLLLKLFAGNSRNLKPLFAEISQLVGIGTGASARNEAADG